MKAKVFLSVLVCALLCSCNNKSTSPIIGTWQLVNGQYKTADTVVHYPGNLNGNHWKIITRSHFATIYQDTTSKRFLSTGFNGGTYTYTNGIYTESFSHTSLSNSQIGTKITFKATIEGDKLLLSPCSEDGKELKSGNFEEYKRLD